MTLDIYERRALTPEALAAHDAAEREALRAATLATLNERFAGLTLWPAAQVKAVIGVDPLTIDVIRRSPGPLDVPRVDPLTRLANCIEGNPMLGFVVDGADVLAWVEAQP
jgi:hypothetical protein